MEAFDEVDAYGVGEGPVGGAVAGEFIIEVGAVVKEFGGLGGVVVEEKMLGVAVVEGPDKGGYGDVGANGGGVVDLVFVPIAYFVSGVEHELAAHYSGVGVGEVDGYRLGVD